MQCILITPARNEEEHIEKTIRSVISQTLRPAKWIIVNDGSTDRTAEIIDRYAAGHGWIERFDMPPHRDRSFAAKAHCFNAAYDKIRHLQYDVIGNLDSDLSFDPDYLEFLMMKFREDPYLGVAGTPFKEEDGYDSAQDSFEGAIHVAGGCQLFRRECFEDVGGYIPNKAGGVDWIAVTTARMKGWKTRSFNEKRFLHYRSLGTAERGTFSSLYSYGEKDYYLGNHPLWELFRFTYRVFKRPYLIGSAVMATGYIWALIRRIDRPISLDLMRFHRREEMRKLKVILGALLCLKRVDNFYLMTDKEGNFGAQAK